MMNRARATAAALSILIAGGTAMAASPAEHPTGSRTTPPTIESIAPRGVPRGAVHTIVVEGYNLLGAASVHFDDPSVRGTVRDVAKMPTVPEEPRLGAGGFVSTVDLGPQPIRYRVEVDVTVNKEADVGPVRFLLATDFGLSPAGKILLEPEWDVVSEGGPDGHDSTADDHPRVTLPAVMSGVVSKPGDADYFSITVEAGQELVFEEAGMQVGSKIRPVIDLLSANHDPVRLGSAGRGRADPFFAHHFDMPGDYIVRVSDYEKSGSSDHFYRLRVGEFALIQSAYPLGVRRGAEAAITLEGLNVGDGSVNVKGEPSWLDDRRVVLRPRIGREHAFNTLKLELGEHPEVEADGGNTSVSAAQTVAIPVTVNGRLTATDQFFRFVAREDETVLVDVTAAQLGSPLDSVVEILTADGEQIETVTLRGVAVTYTDLFDHTSEQAEIRLQLSNDFDAGDYLMLGSEVMLVTRMPRQPDEGIALESFPPIIPGRPTGGAVRLASFGTSPQAHAKGTPMYKMQVHPPGSKFPANGLPVIRLHYRNDDGPFPRGKDSFLRFTAPADGEYVVRIRDSHGRSGEAFSYRLALRPPRHGFQLSSEPRTPNVPQGGRVPIRVTALREDGFDGPIHVTVEGLPAGLSAADTVIPPGQMVATVMLRADPRAPVGGAYPLTVRATAEIGGREVSKAANPADRMQFVSVVAPADIAITTDTREVVLEPGQDATIRVTVERRNGFAGRVPVEVLNLPPHTDTPEVGLNRIMVTEELDTRTFSIRALANAKPLEQLIYVSGVVETRSPQATSYLAEPIALKIVKKGAGARSAD